MLDDDAYDAARLRGDPAYDGVFFIAVLTTKIYCRPICPAKSSLRKNIIFLPSAAACEESGYRPCLRCRPESAPFSPAWNGTKTTVERALKLIDQGALDNISMEEFAGKLGLGARQLSRLFQKHLGTSPSQAAKTARVQRAKRMLDETDLSMTDIAFKSGFKSLRRFNTVFKETYRRPPSSIKRDGSNPKYARE